jgi:hypothetical protein
VRRLHRNDPGRAADQPAVHVVGGFPLFLPEGVTVNAILRAQVAIIMFTAAYIAEVVRGGLAGMAKGQYEAAESLGLNYYQTMRLVILPQALKIVIPPTVSILISAFKDTSLVVIIALYDLLKTTQSDPVGSDLDGIFGRSLHLRGLDLFCLLFFHVQLQPAPGKGAGQGRFNRYPLALNRVDHVPGANSDQ